jgi:hypothetical protein
MPGLGSSAEDFAARTSCPQHFLGPRDPHAQLAATIWRGSGTIGQVAPLRALKPKLACVREDGRAVAVYSRCSENRIPSLRARAAFRAGPCAVRAAATVSARSDRATVGAAADEALTVRRKFRRLKASRRRVNDGNPTWLASGRRASEAQAEFGCVESNGRFASDKRLGEAVP